MCFIFKMEYLVILGSKHCCFRGQNVAFFFLLKCVNIMLCHFCHYRPLFETKKHTLGVWSVIIKQPSLTSSFLLSHRGPNKKHSYLE